MSRLWQNVPFPGKPTQGEFLYSAQFCTEDVVVAGGSGTSGAGIIHTGTGQVRPGGEVESREQLAQGRLPITARISHRSPSWFFLAAHR